METIKINKNDFMHVNYKINRDYFQYNITVQIVHEVKDFSLSF